MLNYVKMNNKGFYTLNYEKTENVFELLLIAEKAKRRKYFDFVNIIYMKSNIDNKYYYYLTIYINKKGEK